MRRGRELLENFQKASFEEKTKKHGKLSKAKHLSFHPPFIILSSLFDYLFSSSQTGNPKKNEKKKMKKKKWQNSKTKQFFPSFFSSK